MRWICAILALGAFCLLAAPAQAAEDLDQAIRTWDEPALVRIYDGLSANRASWTEFQRNFDRQDYLAAIGRRSEPDVRLILQQSGFGADGPAKRDKPEAPEPKSVVEALQDAGFRLRRAVQGPVSGAPARFAYVYDYDPDPGTDDEVFTAQFALMYRPPTGIRLSSRASLYGSTSYEANLTSAGDKSSTYSRWRGGAELQWNLGPLSGPGSVNPYHMRGVLQSIQLKVDSDQEGDTRKASIEAVTTPLIGAVGMGTVLPWPQCPGTPFTYSWQPQLLLEAGTTRERGDTQETGSDFLRIGFALHGELHFVWLMDALGMRKGPKDEGEDAVPAFLPYLYVDYVGRYLNHSTPAWREYLVVGFNLPLSDYVSIDAAYERGSDSPDFEHVERFSIALGIMF
jgi:hypothetical protein